MSIKIFLTGGTFDKEYNEIDGTLYFKETHMPEMLLLGRNKVDVDISKLMLIDSLEMTDKHRDLLINSIKETKSNQIIITHGTDTMVDTAHIIAEQIKDKIIIIVGAMIPYKFGSSDGLFNLGAALAYAQTLPKGVYITMNGQYFTYDNCRKNRQSGFFETLS